ncbi:MAG TPA: hypothetical protein VE987_19295 [Polyangiaceae bacterium]|nr:hypothetical protein [Polyangiaceae bacterium]
MSTARRRLLGAALLGLAAGCGQASPAASDASATTASDAPAEAGEGSSESAGPCALQTQLGDAGSGIRACRVGAALLDCSYASGVGCGAGTTGGALTVLCVSDDPTACPTCDAGATCQNRCGPTQYAIACGGPPPVPSIDGAPAFTYEQAPDACVGSASTPGGVNYYCCPCE